MQDSASTAVYLACALPVLFILKRAFIGKKSALDAIPTIGYSTPILSYISAIKFLFWSQEMLQEGYEKYPGGTFKLPMLETWIVVVNGQKQIDDIRKAPEDVLSFGEGFIDHFQMDHIFSHRVGPNPYQITVVRTALGRNFSSLYSDTQDEIAAAFEDIIPCKGDEWLKIAPLVAMENIACRVTNRLYVGVPLCRDPGYIYLNVHFSLEFMKGRLVSFFPDFLKPLAARLCTNVHTCIEETKKYIGPMVEHRLEQERLLGNDWVDKPNDLLMWLMDAVEGEEKNLHNLSIRMLIMNFAAIHSTSMSFTHTLFELAVHPEYIQELRDEVEPIIREYGWTKASIGMMHKVDSCLRESQRHHGIKGTLLDRMVMKDFQLSDGTVLEPGTMLCANSFAVHHENEFYENPYVFDPFRYSKESNRSLMVTPTSQYMAFGGGRSSCPGRFFVVTEMKTMLAHVLLNYDFKLEKGTERPSNQWIDTAILPNDKANLLFRRRSA